MEDIKDIENCVLGFGDGDKEWDEIAHVNDMFLHTESYEKFKEPHCHFLFGRRGTGKTSCVRMLEYEIINGNSKQFQIAVRLNSEDIFKMLSAIISDLHINACNISENDFIKISEELWDWCIQVILMTEIYVNNNSILDNSALIEAYLNELGIDKASYQHDPQTINPAVKLLNKFDITAPELFVSGQLTHLSVIKLLEQQVKCKRYQDALQELHQSIISNNKHCLILVDSIETYDIKDASKNILVSGLIEVAQTVAKKRNNISLKAVFPSEIYPSVSIRNTGKAMPLAIFIRWKHKQLASMLAIRVRKKLNNISSKKEIDILHKFENAKGYLYKYFPRFFQTRSGLKIDGLAFLIGHTQKTPRQIIQLFGEIVSKKDLSIENVAYDSIVKKELFTRIESIVSDIFGMYQQVYPNIKDIVDKVLAGRPVSFSATDLDHYLKSAKKYTTEADFDKEKLRRLLLSIGVIGIKTRETILRNKRKTKLIEAKYEYQIKEISGQNELAEYVIHPMFYSHLNTNSNSLKQVLVYPKPFEDEESKIIEELGVELA